MDVSFYAHKICKRNCMIQRNNNGNPFRPLTLNKQLTGNLIEAVVFLFVWLLVLFLCS